MTFADSIKIDSDERGFELHIYVDEEPEVDENGLMVLNIHACAQELLEEVQKTIGPWLEEGERARHSVRVTREDLEAYEPGDPKRATLEILLDGRDEVIV